MANVKLSAIAASPSNFAATDQFVGVRSAATDLLFSYAQINAGLALFSTTTTTQGVVPGSNNVGATFFLNATGAWSVPAGGAGAPGGSTLQVQYNNAGAFGGVNEYVESANVLAQRNGLTAQAHYVYNTFTDASNYERGAFDWSTTANLLSVGVQNLGTGAARDLLLMATTTNVYFQGGGTIRGCLGLDTSNADGLILRASGCFMWSNASGAMTRPPAAADAGLIRVTAGVVGPGVNSVGIANGWLQWGGEARVTSNFSGASSNIALADITGLSVNVQAGRTYAFYAYLACQTTTAAAGLRAGIGGTCTATNIVYDGYCLDTNTTKGQARAAALGGVVANSGTLTTATGAIIEIQGEITVNVAGTLTVQIAQSVSTAASPPVVLQGSYLWVHDMP